MNRPSALRKDIPDVVNLMRLSLLSSIDGHPFIVHQHCLRLVQQPTLDKFIHVEEVISHFLAGLEPELEILVNRIHKSCIDVRLVPYFHLVVA
jgi:hypothetical protein